MSFSDITFTSIYVLKNRFYFETVRYASYCLGIVKFKWTLFIEQAQRKSASFWYGADCGHIYRGNLAQSPSWYFIVSPSKYNTYSDVKRRCMYQNRPPKSHVTIWPGSPNSYSSKISGKCMYQNLALLFITSIRL